MIKIPRQLQNPNLRFYLAGSGQKWGKIAIEPSWNSTCNYSFFDERLLNHPKNYGVCTGFGNLIVLDFDDAQYHESCKGKLPPTFTVRTANKQLPHMYYYLEGDMIKKESVTCKTTGKTLLDIQASKVGVIGPGSTINRRFYEVINDRPIATIKLSLLQSIFPFKAQTYVEYTGPLSEDSPVKVKLALNLMKLLKVVQTKHLLFKCPFHPMEGKGNLSVMDSGRIHCFHEQKTWNTAYHFAADVAQHNQDQQMQELIHILRRYPNNEYISNYFPSR